MQPEEILDTCAAEVRANMRHYSIWPGNYALVVPPQLRAHLARAGWSKADVRECVFRKARIRRSEWRDCGKGSVVGERGDRELMAQALGAEGYRFVVIDYPISGATLEDLAGRARKAVAECAGILCGTGG